MGSHSHWSMSSSKPFGHTFIYAYTHRPYLHYPTDPAYICKHIQTHKRTGAEPGEELVEVQLVVVDVLVEARGVHLVAPVVPALVELLRGLPVLIGEGPSKAYMRTMVYLDQMAHTGQTSTDLCVDGRTDLVELVDVGGRLLALGAVGHEACSA